MLVWLGKKMPTPAPRCHPQWELDSTVETPRNWNADFDEDSVVSVSVFCITFGLDIAATKLHCGMSAGAT